MSNGECFKKDFLGNNIVNFVEKPLEDKGYLLALHQKGNTCLCLTSLFLNFILSIIILKCSSNMQKIRPILWFGIIVDSTLAFLNLLSAPYANLSYGRLLAITNGPLNLDDWLANGIIMGFVGWIVLSSWICLPCQFIYRYHLVKTGERPQGRFLVFFLSVVILVMISSFLMPMYLYTTPLSKKFLDDTLKILEHHGLRIPSHKIHGAEMNDQRIQVYNLYFMLLMVGTYFVVIYCAFAIRKFLRNTAMSSKTKRLNSDMDKVLFTLSMTPILTSVIPSVYITIMLPKCDNFTLSNVFISWLIVVAPLINACMTIYFMQPYRRFLIAWITFNPHQMNSIESTKNNSVTSTNFKTTTNNNTIQRGSPTAVVPLPHISSTNI